MKERMHEYCHRLLLPVMTERWSARVEYATTHNIPYFGFFSLLEEETVEKHEQSIRNTHQNIQTTVSQDDRYV
jgi:hypothetical protein